MMNKLPSTFALLLEEVPGFVRAELCNGKILMTVRDIHYRIKHFGKKEWYTYRTTVYGGVPMPESETGQALGAISEYSTGCGEAATRIHVSLLCLLESGKPLPKGDL